MIFPAGVTASLRLLGQSVDIPHEGDGFLGPLDPELQYFLRVQVTHPEHPVFMANQRGDILSLKPRQSAEGTAYRLKIPTGVLNNGAPKLAYPSNAIRVLEVVRPSRVNHWEVAIVNRGGQFFLTVQETYQFHLRRQAGKRFTVNRNWAQMDDLLTKLLHDQWQHISANPLTQTPPPVEKFGPSSGRVLYFNQASGRGILIINDGQSAAFGWQDVLTGERFKTLSGGSLVEYEHLDPPMEGRSYPRARGIRAV